MAYRGFDAAELDRQYSPSKWVQRMSGDEAIAMHCANLQTATDQAKQSDDHVVELSVRYDADAGSCLHFFSPKNISTTDLIASAAPVVCFVHGGYWTEGVCEDMGAFFADHVVRAGGTFVAIKYCLSQEKHPAGAGRIGAIVSSVRRAVGTIWCRYQGKRPIYAVGHSAGGHLTSMLLATDWKAYGVPACNVAGAVLMSGIYDLEPIRTSCVQKESSLGLSEADVAENSPLLSNALISSIQKNIKQAAVRPSLAREFMDTHGSGMGAVSSPQGSAPRKSKQQWRGNSKPSSASVAAAPLVVSSLPPAATVAVVVAAQDSVEFIRQSRELHEKLQGAGVRSSFMLVEGADHFDIIENMRMADDVVTCAVMAMAFGAGAGAGVGVESPCKKAKTGATATVAPQVAEQAAADFNSRKRDFFLFGHPIGASPSPLLHNTGFQALGLPHVYSLLDTSQPAECGEAVQREGFGGASVTIPHKEKVQPFLSTQSDAALTIGAVNTIVVTESSTGADGSHASHVLHGDNTDWVAMHDLVRAKLAARRRRHAEPRWALALNMDTAGNNNTGAGVGVGVGPAGGEGVALVVGAGGTSLAAAYAVKQLGLDLIVHNRTHTKAQTVAGRFGGSAIETLTPEALPAVDVVISTVPAAAGFELPAHLLSPPNRPVILDAAYKPAVTKLIAQARAAKCPYLLGAQMLVEQGLCQFELWTGRRAPKQAMRAAVLADVRGEMDREYPLEREEEAR